MRILHWLPLMLLLLASVISGVGCSSSGFAKAPPESSNWLIDILPAVVRVSTDTFAGSGVVIDPTGVVLTSAHVVGNSPQVKVQIKGSRLTGEVTRLDTLRDLALVQLPPGNYTSARVSPAPQATLGAKVTAIGYPLDLAGPATITVGIVSRTFYQTPRNRKIIQTDAAINEGNSGGPLLSESGQVIGVIVSMFAHSEGINYAVAITGGELDE